MSISKLKIETNKHEQKHQISQSRGFHVRTDGTGSLLAYAPLKSVVSPVLFMLRFLLRDEQVVCCWMIFTAACESGISPQIMTFCHCQHKLPLVYLLASTVSLLSHPLRIITALHVFLYMTRTQHYYVYLI